MRIVLLFEVPQVARARHFRGGSLEVVAAPSGEILALGRAARAAAGRDAEVVELRGTVWPGLQDAHLHLSPMAMRRLGVELTGSRSLEACLATIQRRVQGLPRTDWVRGRGWYNDDWRDSAFPHRGHLDRAAGGRPAFMVRKDGHSAWVSSAALAAAGIGRETPDPPGGVIDRDSAGDPTGIVREKAVELVRQVVPEPSDAELDRGLASTLRELARLGLTSVHSMDRAREFGGLQRLHQAGPLPVRVTYNLPYADLAAAERVGVRSGWGDGWLRIWGVKAFLDGSLGSRTAEMLDGSGVPVLEQSELVELCNRCAEAHLNVALHAIGDRAVRRALDALQPLAGAWRWWRPRIEHAQCVHPDDWPRFAAAGVIASMQPIHAVADRELADREWSRVTANAYAWGALERAGARLAFGSDAPVESADPLLGIDAAVRWRQRAKWYPGLAVSQTSALRAYTSGAAYAGGHDRVVGRLRPGYQCDLTVVEDGRVTATVAGGRVTFRSRR
ncbi:MAG TPA: amidohydrolase [Candidatus Dormibacteraeota bacterium]